MNIFWGMKTLWIFFWAIGLYLGIISIHFKVFSEGQGKKWGIYFWVAKISNIFFAVFEIPDIFWGEG